MAMNFEGVIDFTKYTLALAAAGLVYTFETFIPAPSAIGRFLALSVMLIFLIASIAGVFIFAVSTAALHDASRETAARKRIKILGVAHSVLLVVGMAALGGMLVPKILAPPSATAMLTCPCVRR